jgi:uncharacterized membrane protein (DUF4010 family)
VAWPLAVGAAALLMAAALGALRAGRGAQLPEEGRSQAFRLSHALMLAGAMGLLLLLSAWLQGRYGSAGVLVASAAVALAELHAAAASVAQLAADSQLDIQTASWGLLLLLLVSALAKSVLAFVSGGANYGWRVAAGLLLMTAAAAVTLLLQGQLP